MRVVRVAEGHELGQRAVGQGSELAVDERLVRARGATHGLRCIVDQDVERALSRDGLGEADDLCGVAEVDSDDAQAVQPVCRIGQAREAANGIPRKAGRDGGVGAIPQQSQRDIHADLGATAGEQGALATEIGARVSLSVIERRATRAELVIERVDSGVRLLADITGARFDEFACRRRRCARRNGDAASFVIDAVCCTGGGRCDDVTVGVSDCGPFLETALLLHRFEHRCRRAAYCHKVGVLFIHAYHLAQHLQRNVELCRVKAARGVVGGVRRVRHTRFYPRY